MATRNSSSKSAKAPRKKTQSRKRESESPSMGGREFGQVIEPMQAQMASGNEGLAETSDSADKKQSRSLRRMNKAA